MEVSRERPCRDVAASCSVGEKSAGTAREDENWERIIEIRGRVGEEEGAERLSAVRACLLARCIHVRRVERLQTKAGPGTSGGAPPRSDLSTNMFGKLFHLGADLILISAFLAGKYKTVFGAFGPQR